MQPGPKGRLKRKIALFAVAAAAREERHRRTGIAELLIRILGVENGNAVHAPASSAEHCRHASLCTARRAVAKAHLIADRSESEAHPIFVALRGLPVPIAKIAAWMFRIATPLNVSGPVISPAFHPAAFNPRPLR